MSMVATAVRRPVTVSMFVLAIMLFGMDRVSNRVHTLATVLVSFGIPCWLYAYRQAKSN